MTEKSYLDRAMAAYYRAASSKEGIFTQPSNQSGIEKIGEKEYAVLRNTNGVLAVYRIRNDGVLKGLKRWPKEIL